jgi:hypothetical protein
MPRSWSVRARFAALTAAVGVLGTLSTARSHTETFTVTWDAPADSCPDQAYVRRGVEQLLGEGGPPAARVEADARVEHLDDGQWRVNLATLREGERGGRTLESTSCRSLADATALIVALTIDPERVAAHRTSALTPEQIAAALAPDFTAAPETASIIPSASSAPPPSLGESPGAAAGASPVPLAVLAGVSGDVGTLPHPAYGLTLGAAFLWERLRLEAYGAYWSTEAGQAVGASPGVGGNFFLADGGLRGCWLPVLGRFEIAACPGLELGVLHGQGVGVNEPLSQSSVWVAATALGRVSWRIAPFFDLYLEAGIALPFRRDVFDIDVAKNLVHEAGVVEGRASLGPELRF